MLKKICPYCNNSSFSSSTLGGPWLCPKCMKDISHVPTEAPEPKAQLTNVSAKQSWLKFFQNFFKK